MEKQLSAMNSALAGLFDYAGMFPPAGQDLGAAVRDYLQCRRGQYASALGRFVIDGKALSSLRDQFAAVLNDLRLSVIATGMTREAIQQHLDNGLSIEMIELKADDRIDILRWNGSLPSGIATYVEVPVCLGDFSMLNVMGEAGMRAKLRMGGVVAEAFPSAASVAAMLKMLAEKKIPFKATAGLHHPLRSRHPFTHREDSQVGMMHGFMNLLCAATLVWFGGKAEEAQQLLEEQDPRAWHVAANSLQWRSWNWSANQLQEVRERFLISIGSCSFSEPMNDLETLGWL